jgi:hypothetical protein
MEGLPVLTNLARTIAETVIEAIQKKPWTAFIDNTFDFGDVAFKNKKLVQEFAEVANNPDLLDKVRADVLSHPKVKEFGEEKGGQVFNVIWQALVFNSKAALKIKGIIEE